MNLKNFAAEVSGGNVYKIAVAYAGTSWLSYYSFWVVIGALGDWTYRRSGYDLRSLPILVHKLLQSYPSPHEVVVYEAPIFPGCAPTIARIPLAQLGSVPLSAGSTLYVPPARPANPDYHVLPYVPTNC